MAADMNNMEILADLHELYESRLQQFGVGVSVHKTCLKDEIISHM